MIPGGTVRPRLTLVPAPVTCSETKRGLRIHWACTLPPHGPEQRHVYRGGKP